ncbi:MAG: HAD family hydrolase [Bauldia litoralis]
MNLPAPTAVLFDWDNTLVDNWITIRDGINAALTAFGHAPWTEAETRHRVRQSLRDSFPALFGDEWERARDLFYETVRAGHLKTLKVIAGAPEMLAGLANAGLYLGVVSNKRGDLLRREAEQLGWTQYFGRLVGAGDADHDKPAIDPVLMALSAGPLKPNQSVWFVGDAAIDMECAIRADCTPILVRTGDEAEDAFSAWPPRHTVTSLDELPTLVDRSSR